MAVLYTEMLLRKPWEESSTEHTQMIAEKIKVESKRRAEYPAMVGLGYGDARSWLLGRSPVCLGFEAVLGGYTFPVCME